MNDDNWSTYFAAIDFAACAVLILLWPEYIIVWGGLAFAAPFVLVGILSILIYVTDHWPTATGKDSRKR
jgi:hypothetical protein